jgi:hypothetical protein
VVHDNKGRPIPGAKVTLIGARAVASGATDFEGNFRLPAVPEGAYTALVEAAAFQSARYTSLALAPGASQALTFKLERGNAWSAVQVGGGKQTGAIAGQLLQQDGSPAIGLDVVAVPAPGAPQALPSDGLMAPGIAANVAVTDSSGRFRIDGLPPDFYVLAAGVVIIYNQPGNVSGGCARFCGPYLRGPMYLPASGGAIEVTTRAASEVVYRLPAVPPEASPVSAAAGPEFRVSGMVREAPTAPGRRQQSITLRRQAVGTCQAQAALFRGRGNPLPASDRAQIRGNIAWDGSFDLPRVPPGTWLFCVSSAFSPNSMTQVGVIDVIDRDRRGLLMALPSAAAADRVPPIAGFGPLRPQPSGNPRDLNALEQQARRERDALDAAAKKQQEARKKAEKEAANARPSR